MRTTLSLDDDVAVMLQRLQQTRRISLKQAVNDALRAGLIRLDDRPGPKTRYRMKPVSLGRCKLPSLDNIAEVLAIVEGEDHK
jgi:hypothetical protein